MSDYVLLTDSSADLTAELVAELGVGVDEVFRHDSSAQG